ncbi:IS21 family transposase [Megasphaera paucivorans]|uniref:Transposase n=1 Tax=Megasphaera paucivorans TaxID=349095 RepID=A0A1G9ZSL7_9FIRM|nr:IS21 family transposase [Megasphaera paucivorans]SDN24117.1 Transposase [Megasphaera paucivorans]
MQKFLCNSLDIIVSQALNEMKEEQGIDFKAEAVNLVELQRRTGISRAKLRKLKKNNFKVTEHGRKGYTAQKTILSGYTDELDYLLRQGIKNSSICLQRLHDSGYSGGLTTLKNYISQHKSLLPAKRQQIMPQGNRGRRFVTKPGEAYQMDWGFTNVTTNYGQTLRAACFAMICHHCGQRYIEFFPNAKQENLFIGMIHAFRYMGVPAYILTDNMKSVVTKRDWSGQPIWQKDYEAFMKTIGFQTKLCKPRHPFTKGKVERLIRFVKDNFLIGRIFWNVTDLNRAALDWCNEQNTMYHPAVDGMPEQIHDRLCSKLASVLPDEQDVQCYLCPERRITFDGFVNYENRRFGIPFSYTGKTARIKREDDVLYIYSSDLQHLLTTHHVTWSKRDRFCADQYVTAQQPEEFPTAPIQSHIGMLSEPVSSLSFDKFNFDKEDTEDE